MEITAHYADVTIKQILDELMRDDTGDWLIPIVDDNGEPTGKYVLCMPGIAPRTDEE